MTSHRWTIKFTLHVGRDTGGKYVHGPSFFDGGMATIQAARIAETYEHANDILLRAYKGVPGSGAKTKWIEWEIKPWSRYSD